MVSTLRHREPARLATFVNEFDLKFTMPTDANAELTGALDIHHFPTALPVEDGLITAAWRGVLLVRVVATCAKRLLLTAITSGTGLLLGGVKMTELSAWLYLLNIVLNVIQFAHRIYENKRPKRHKRRRRYPKIGTRPNKSA